MYPNDYKIYLDNFDNDNAVEIVIEGKDRAEALYEFLKNLYQSEKYLDLKMYRLNWYEEILVKELSIRK